MEPGPVLFSALLPALLRSSQGLAEIVDVAMFFKL